MEKRRKPANACRMQPDECACGQGFIVERVISSRRCDTCFDGHLFVRGLPRGLCEPLRLCSVQVLRIDAAACCDTPAAAPDCTVENRPVRLTLTLLCCVEDARGCRAEGTACVEIEDACAAVRPCVPGANLRRGAQLRIARVHFCPPCGFHVCMDICLHEVVSRCEMITGAPKPCAPDCPQLPLYPQPRRSW